MVIKLVPFSIFAPLLRPPSKTCRVLLSYEGVIMAAICCASMNHDTNQLVFVVIIGLFQLDVILLLNA